MSSPHPSLRPPLTSPTDAFGPTCPPAFLFYPSYAAALNLLILSASLSALTTSARSVTTAYRGQLLCYSAVHNKAWRHRT